MNYWLIEDYFSKPCWLYFNIIFNIIILLKCDFYHKMSTFILFYVHFIIFYLFLFCFSWLDLILLKFIVFYWIYCTSMYFVVFYVILWFNFSWILWYFNVFYCIWLVICHFLPNLLAYFGSKLILKIWKLWQRLSVRRKSMSDQFIGYLVRQNSSIPRFHCNRWLFE